MTIEEILHKVRSLDVHNDEVWIQGIESVMARIQDSDNQDDIVAYVYLKASIERLKRHKVVGEAGVIDKTTESRDKIKSDTLKSLQKIQEKLSK